MKSSRLSVKFILTAQFSQVLHSHMRPVATTLSNARLEDRVQRLENGGGVLQGLRDDDKCLSRMVVMGLERR